MTHISIVEIMRLKRTKEKIGQDKNINLLLENLNADFRSKLGLQLGDLIGKAFSFGFFQIEPFGELWP